MFRVLVSDKIAKEGLAPLLESGQVEIVEKSVDDAKDLDTYDALLVRSATKVTDAVMEKMAGLKIIGRAGVGVDNIDVPAATRRGLVVVNAPDANTIATADHGQKVAKRARAFEMNVLAYSRSITPEKAGAAGAQASSLEEILTSSDIITVHTPATPETKGLLGEENLRKTKPGVMIINAARGGIVDEAALKRLLDSGHIAAAALDVFTQEPPESYELMQMEQVTATPHIAASTREAQLKVARVVAEEVLNFAMGRPVRNRVN